MKFVRQVVFLLALAVMLGHDFVSHAHEDIIAEHNISVSHLSENNHKGLEHAFAHLKHTSVERQINYAGSLSKKSDVQGKKNAFDTPCLVNSDFGILWYANLKKHLFWDLIPIATSYTIFPSSLRGPPSC